MSSGRNGSFTVLSLDLLDYDSKAEDYCQHLKGVHEVTVTASAFVVVACDLLFGWKPPNTLHRERLQE